MFYLCMLITKKEEVGELYKFKRTKKKTREKFL